MPRNAKKKTKVGFFRVGSQRKPALVWMLLLDLIARPNFPTEVYGFEARADMSECLLVCQVAYLVMYFIFVCILASSEHLCRLHHQGAGHVPVACVLDDTPSATWRHAVQVWGPPLVLPLDVGHPIGAAHDAADDARLCLGCLEPEDGYSALDRARQVGQSSGGDVRFGTCSVEAHVFDESRERGQMF